MWITIRFALVLVSLIFVNHHNAVKFSADDWNRILQSFLLYTGVEGGAEIARRWKAGKDDEK